MREWHKRYASHGLKVIAVHSPQFDFGKDPRAGRGGGRAPRRPVPVAADSDYAIWRLYGTEVWPSLYLWDRTGSLRHHHFAEGGYRETELAIQMALREIDAELELPEPMLPLRPTDPPGRSSNPPPRTPYLEPDRSGRPIAAGRAAQRPLCRRGRRGGARRHGGVEVLLNGEWINTFELDGPRLYDIVDTNHHQRHELTLVFDGPATAYAFSFSAGPALAPQDQPPPHALMPKNSASASREGSRAGRRTATRARSGASSRSPPAAPAPRV